MSALDGRIRHLAREEAVALLDGSAVSPTGAADDRVTALEKEVADLRDRLDRLEKTAASTSSPRRTARKETSE